MVLTDNPDSAYSPSVPRGTSSRCSKIKCLIPDTYTSELSSKSVPKSKRISSRCEAALPASDLEMLSCPACPDSFLLPTSFFQVLPSFDLIKTFFHGLLEKILCVALQHINRTSVHISLECPPCNKVSSLLKDKSCNVNYTGGHIPK